MRTCLAIATLTLIAAPAWAGSMGDPSVVLKEKNAICEKQRRGEGPLYPNLCLPELPVTPVYAEPARRG